MPRCIRPVKQEQKQRALTIYDSTNGTRDGRWGQPQQLLERELAPSGGNARSKAYLSSKKVLPLQPFNVRTFFRRRTVRARARDTGAVGEGNPAMTLARALRGWIISRGGRITGADLAQFYKSSAARGLSVPKGGVLKLLRTVAAPAGLRIAQSGPRVVISSVEPATTPPPPPPPHPKRVAAAEA